MSEDAAITAEWEALLQEYRAVPYIGPQGPEHLPGAAVILARPPEQGAAIVAAGLRVIAATPFVTPSAKKNSPGSAHGEADHVVGSVLKLVLRRRIVFDVAAARETLGTLATLAPRLFETGIVACDYLFPFHAVIRALDRSGVGPSPELRDSVTRLRDAIRAEPERRERARRETWRALDRSATRSAGMSDEAAALRRALQAKDEAEAIEAAATRPEASFSSELRGSLATMETWLATDATGAVTLRLEPDDWGLQAQAWLDAMPEAQRVRWQSVLQALAGVTPSKPSKTWLASARSALSGVDAGEVTATAAALLRMLRTTEGAVERDGTAPRRGAGCILGETNAGVLAGLAWSLTLTPGRALADAVAEAAAASGRKVRMVGPRSRTVHAACIKALRQAGLDELADRAVAEAAAAPVLAAAVPPRGPRLVDDDADAAPPKARAPKSRRRSPLEIARTRFCRRLMERLPAFSLEGEAHAGSRVFLWEARPGLAFFIEYQPDARFDPRFTVNLGWNTTAERSFKLLRPPFEQHDAGTLRLGHVMPGGKDTWWSLRSPCASLEDARPAWEQMDGVARRDVLLFSPLRDACGKPLQELWNAMTGHERQDFLTGIARWRDAQESPEAAAARIEGTVDEALDAVEKHAMPLFRRVLLTRG